MRHLYRKKIIYCGLLVIILIIFLHPDMNGHGTYDFIAKDNILRNLHMETAVNFTSGAVIDCEYYDVVGDDTTVSPSLVDGDLVEGHGIREGGEYAPQECKPKFSTAIIVPYRFVLPYLTLFGGAIAIISKQYKDINGMSNEYFGWGGEDDDLYSRLEAHHLKMCRFAPETSRYHMVTHRSQQKGETRKKLLNLAKKRMMEDGLSSLHYVEVATVLHPLFTHIMVDL